MNSNKAIGIFDSGVGGLTVVQQIQKKLPKENLIYFGDTARVPYGTKAPETIKKFSIEIADFLVNKNVKCIVIACNSASAHAIHSVRKKYPKLPIYGMIESGSEFAIAQSKTKKIGVIGTDATIKSKAYKSYLKRLNKNCTIHSLSCPLFVPYVEEGLYDNDLIDSVIEHYLKDFKQTEIDTLILGCTHYPFLKEKISTFLGKSINLIDSGEAAAEYLYEHLKNTENEMPKSDAFYHCYLTSSTNKFFTIAGNCLIKPFEEINYVDID